MEQLTKNQAVATSQEAVQNQNKPDRKSGSAGMPRPNWYAVFCLKKKRERYGAELRSASRLRRPPPRGESGKVCAAASANLLAFVYGQPRAWIEGYVDLTELDREDG